MIKAKYEFHGDQAFAAIKGKGWDGIRRATVYLWQRIQLVLNVPNSGEDWPIEGGKGRTRRAYPNSSKPGEPPRKITGFGAGNVLYAFDEDKLSSKVGILKNGSYMIDLELGNQITRVIEAKGKALMIPDKRRKMWIFRKRARIGPLKPRPWLLATVKTCWSQLKALIEG